MRNKFSLTSIRAAAAFLALLVAPVFAFAQGETFDDCDAWTAAVCGTVVGDDFESWVDENGDLLEEGTFGGIPTPQTLSYGELSQQGNVPDAVSVLVLTDPNNPDAGPVRGALFDGGRPAEFSLNGDMGPLEGVCFNFRVNTELEQGLIFNAYDGDTLVVTELATPEFGDDGNAVDTTFGWRNTEGLNITRFEFGVDAGNLGLVSNGQLSFGELCAPEPETCFEQLESVKANVEEFVLTLDGDNLCYAEGALDCICWMQSDYFWEQPSGNRLTQHGGSLFVGAAYTILYLEWVDDPQADVLIDELVEVLDCIVDNEIAYAIENGGHQCYIDRAEDFAELGDIIDDDFDNEVVATLAYRLAWLHAFYATY